jgi:hypothetical protein
MAQLGPGRLPSARATAVAVLGHLDCDLGQLGDLVAGGSADLSRSPAAKRYPHPQLSGQCSATRLTALIGESPRPLPRLGAL